MEISQKGDAWEWKASDKVVVKSSGKFRGSKRLSLCWMENGSLVGSEEGGAAGAEMDRGGTISEQKQRPDTRTCPWIGCGGRVNVLGLPEQGTTN